MASLKIFDPAMCCSTGVCGPSFDPELARFAADLDWLTARGVDTARFNFAQQPDAFAETAAVREALDREGRNCLPIVLLDGEIVSRARYPTREELAAFVKLEVPRSLFSPQVQELVAISAAIAASCEPCFRFHYDKARKLGVGRDDMAQAVTTAKNVKEAPARAVLELAQRYLQVKLVNAPSQGCCPSGDCAPPAAASGER